MPAWSYLLRILLSLALVLNGATPAMAAAQMDAAAHRVQEGVAPQHAGHGHVAHDRATRENAARAVATHTRASAASTSMSMSTDALPCHHDAGTIASRPADAAPAHEGTTAGKGGHPSPDCCKPGTCQCICVQSLPLLTTAWTAPASPLSQAGHLRPVTRGHAEPVLPHLIRPPIG